MLLVPFSGMGCSATSMYKKAATIGLDLVGDAIDDHEVEQESQVLLGQPAAAADQRHGQPLRVLLDLQTRREVRVYPIRGALLGHGRWVLEVDGGRIAAVSKAKVNPELGKDALKATALDKLVAGKSPAEIQRIEIVGEHYFRKSPRVLRNMPAGNLLRVYDVTSFTDVLGARLLVLEFDAADRCRELRFVGIPATRTR
jgi:hypothetical protein